MQLDLAEGREDRRIDSGRRRKPSRIEGLHLLFDRRFTLAGDAKQPAKQPRCPDMSQQPLLDQRLEHRLQLARRTRQQHDEFFVVFDPQSRRRSVLVRQDDGAPRHHGLTPVDLGCSQPARGKALFNRLEDVGVIIQRAADEIGDNIARQVVVGRSEAARHDEQVASAQRVGDDCLQGNAIVAGNRLALQIDSELIQSLGDEQRVRVDVSRCQHLTADSNHFRFHESQCGAR